MTRVLIDLDDEEKDDANNVQKKQSGGSMSPG
jgi:hypothetical protein